ncbi:MAG: class I SAM-dependent methyltransferase [Salinivenus sp.]
MNFKHEDTLLLVSATALLIGASALAWAAVGGVFAVLVAIILSFAGGVGLLLNVYRSRTKDDRALKEHVQSLLHLTELLDIRAPIPALTGWAASPQLACTLVSLVREHAPEVVVELGSGSSTVVLGYAVEQQGRGHVIALDHDPSYGEQTRATLARHGLSEWAEVRHAPLQDVALEGESWPWYAPTALDDQPAIDMVLVDGPPHELRSRARYPALPMLADRLSDTAVVVLDDVYREDEAAIAEAWSEQFPDFELDIEDSPYGTAVLQRASA